MNRENDVEDIVTATCTLCNTATRHVVLENVSESGEAKGDDSIRWFTEHQIVECRGCSTKSFRQVSYSTEDYHQNEDGSVSIDETVRLYPHRGADTLPIREFYNAPTNLRRIYRETIDCFNNGNYTLCAAGLRAAIEGLCVWEEIEDGLVEIENKDGTKLTRRSKKLDGKISGLHQEGLLTEQHAHLLHEHRFLGNEAVHELEQPSAAELRMAIQILEHTLENMYELPDKARALRQEKLKRRSSR